MSDNLFELYSQKILALATQIPHQEPLAEPEARAKKRSPLCGSEVEVSLKFENGKISEFSQTVNACALGQASAAIFGQAVIGQTEAELATLRDSLQDFLDAKGSAPAAPFDEYIIMEPAQNHRARHASIMLPVEATLAAIRS